MAIENLKKAESLTNNKEAFKNIVYAQQEIDACLTFNKAGDYKRAIEAGKLAVKDYESAEKYLFEGLEGVKKVGDKFMEATGYEYLGWLYRYKGNKKTAKEYFTRAYNLYKSIGAEGYA